MRCYMWLSEEDFERINSLYKTMLSLLKQEFISQNNINIKNALEYINTFYSKVLLENNVDSNLPIIYNLPSDGIFSLCGYQVCRNTNTFLFDFLNELNFNPIIQYIYIDENNDWHKVNANSANHLVVCITYHDSKLFLDLYNGLYFDSKLKPIIIDNSVNISELAYSKQIEDIRNVIDKYKVLHSLGINHTYLYKY